MSYEDLLLRRDYPEIVWGKKEDGTPKVLTAQFNADVLVTGDTIYINEERWAYDVADVKERIEALQEAVRWIEGDLTLAVEKFYAQQVTQGREGPKEVPEPPPAEERWGIETGSGYQVVWDPQGPEDSRFVKNWRAVLGVDPILGVLRVDSTSVIELTGCPRVGTSKDGVTKLEAFLAEDHDSVEISGIGSDLRVKVLLQSGVFIEFGAGAVICRLDKVNDIGIYTYREYFAMTGYGRFVGRWRAGKDVAAWGGSALQVWQS